MIASIRYETEDLRSSVNRKPIRYDFHTPIKSTGIM